MGINLQTPINQLGYGIVGLNILKQFRLNDETVSLFPIGEVEVTNQEDYEAVKNSINNFQSCCLRSPTIKIFHQNLLYDRVGNGKYIGFPIFELDGFNDIEIINLNCPDLLFVCSKWASNIIKSNGKIRADAHVVNLGVDASIFYPFKNEKPESPYRFFSVGKAELRKGHDIILQAFEKAFLPTDDVELHLAIFNPLTNIVGEKYNDDWANFYARSPNSKQIHLYGRMRTQEEVAQFINDCDCGLFPSRAEGWNLELLESMACGKPVIATNYSAHTEYCNDENSFLIRISELENAYDGVFFNGQFRWAKFGESQMNDMIDCMKHVYKKNIRDNPEGVVTSRGFSWKYSYRHLMDGISKCL